MADRDAASAIGENWADRRRQTARSVLRRLVAHAAAGATTDYAPAPMLQHPSVYSDPTRFEAEMRELFLKLPLVAGLSQDLPRPGDVMLFEGLGEHGPSIVITRNRQGVVKAFLNMCTHRGAKLVRSTGEGGVCDARSRLVCPFHAWTFDADGKLIGQPGAAGFEGIEKSSRNLIPVPCAEWRGIIFVKAHAGDEAIDVEGYLGDFAPELAMLELADSAPVKKSVLPANANWKYALDTYGEGYHFAALHASTIGITHYNDVAVYERFGRHHRINFPDKGVAKLIGAPEADWPWTEHGGVHFLFPNTVFFIGAVQPGQVFTQVFRLFPWGPSQTRCQFAVYAPHGILSDEYRAIVEAAHDMTAQVVINEDYVVAAEGTHNMRHAPEGFRLAYGRNEISIQDLHRNIADAIGVPLP
jgi:carnitine monooxygenase subunit